MITPGDVKVGEEKVCMVGLKQNHRTRYHAID